MRAGVFAYIIVLAAVPVGAQTAAPERGVVRAAGNESVAVAEGKLKRPVGKQEWILVDQSGAIRYHVVPAGIELKLHEGEWVGIQGTVTVDPVTRQKVVLAEHVEPLSLRITQTGYTSRRRTVTAASLRATDSMEDAGEFYADNPPIWGAAESAGCDLACDSICDSCGPIAPRDSTVYWFSSVDYLLWKPRRRALDVAIVDSNQDTAPEGPVNSLELPPSSGVRIAFGARQNDVWDFTGEYTHLGASDSLALTAPAGGQLWTSLSTANNVDSATTANANSDVDLDVLDFTYGRWLGTPDAFDVRVFGGWRFAWLDQDLNVVYNGLAANQLRISSPVNLNAYGLRAGAAGHWQFGRRWSLYGWAGSSLLIGTFRTQLVETNNNGATINANVTERFTHAVPVLEMGFGLSRQFRFWAVNVGYEANHWFNVVDSQDFVDDIHEGKSARRTSDLSFDGLFVRLTADW